MSEFHLPTSKPQNLSQKHYNVMKALHAVVAEDIYNDRIAKQIFIHYCLKVFNLEAKNIGYYMNTTADAVRRQEARTKKKPNPEFLEGLTRLNKHIQILRKNLSNLRHVTFQQTDGEKKMAYTATRIEKKAENKKETFEHFVRKKKSKAYREHATELSDKKIPATVTGTNVSEIFKDQLPSGWIADCSGNASIVQNKAMRYGLKMEGVLRPKGYEPIVVERTYEGVQCSGSLDGISEDQKTIVEIKTTKADSQTHRDYQESKLGLHTKHYDQIQFYLWITGAKECIYILSVHRSYTDDGCFKKTILPSNEWQKKLEQALTSFPEKLETGIKYS